jgi:hypothetical protein
VSTSVNEPVSYERQVTTLFRSKDQQSMLRHFDLWSYDDVRAHADAILGRLRAGTMPCDGVWPETSVDLFQQWGRGRQGPVSRDAVSNSAASPPVAGRGCVEREEAVADR